MKSLQEQFAPHNKCFGCGPSNNLGLRIKSFPEDKNLVMSFWPEPHHQAFENILSGGICGTLLDCHSNWCAAYSIMKHTHQETPPCTVTAKYSVQLRAPTPMNKELKIIARSTLITERKAEIYAEISVDGQITASCEGLFISVSPGHPAYHRW